MKFQDKSKGNSPSVIVVEAKMGSSLSKSVTNSPDYDQAARNIACLSKLLLEAREKSGAFFVFMPDGTKHNLGTKSISEAKDFISKASATIKAQKTKREIEDKTNGKKTIAKREYNFGAADEQKFFEIVESMKQSMVLTWDEIIDSMDEKSDNTSGIVNDTEKLRIFYKTALTEIKRK